MKTTDINFLRRQAEQCIALSRATFDLTIAGRLRAMAEELRTQAARWEDDITPVPAAHMVGRSRSANGKSSRGQD